MSTKPYIWSGEHSFDLNGSGLHEDTLRIMQTVSKTEAVFHLFLPTLCITYADLRFQNAIGGKQMNYPASAAYGPAYFDPPIELTGSDIEKFTYIRGAQRVEIGPKQTIIEFTSWQDLVIPRLRMDRQPGTPAHLVAAGVPILREIPLKIVVKQYADGRHVGGITLEARHPQYTEPQLKPAYDLWVRVMDARIHQPLREAIFEIWRWDPAANTPYGPGDFRLAQRCTTDNNGVAQVQGLPSGELQWYTVQKAGWRVMPRCLKPLSHQPVHLHMNAWRMSDDVFRYTWKKDDDLQVLAGLTHFDALDILKMNRLPSSTSLGPGMEITLPCYQARYCPETWEPLQEVARRFRLPDTKTLALLNGWKNIKTYNGSVDLNLPHWRFFHCRPGDSLIVFDRQFDLPAGSTVPAHRMFRPRDDALLPGEVIAVPILKLAGERLVL